MGSAQSKEVELLNNSVAANKETANSPSLDETSATEGDAKDKVVEGGCPMKNADGSYRYDWRAVFQRHPHGSNGSTPLAEDDLTQSANGSLQPQKKAGQGGGGGGCPVKADRLGGEGGSCPVQEYNVYSQPIDSTNQMPSNPNQLPAPGQKKAISTDRVSSSIAKVRTDHLFSI